MSKMMKELDFYPEFYITYFIIVPNQKMKINIYLKSVIWKYTKKI